MLKKQQKKINIAFFVYTTILLSLIFLLFKLNIHHNNKIRFLESKLNALETEQEYETRMMNNKLLQNYDELINLINK